MAKHGTLPEYLYQRRLEVGDKVNLNFGVDEDEGQLFRRKAFSLRGYFIVLFVWSQRCGG